MSAFDKVVGGMVWCIGLCNVDLDVDLFYQENSTIGQKIQLTERIVKVLPELQCPHAIEPHQIQGLDFIHIFPVIQWLVKKAIEAKAEYEDEVKSLAAFQFDSSHVLPEDDVRQKALKKSANVQDILRKSKVPKRLYMRRHDVTNELTDESQRVHSTLLEYGWRKQTLPPSATDHDGSHVDASVVSKGHDGRLKQSKVEAADTSSYDGLEAELTEITQQEANISSRLASALMSRSDKQSTIEAVQAVPSFKLRANSAASSDTTSTAVSTQMIDQPMTQEELKERVQLLTQQLQTDELETERLTNELEKENALLQQAMKIEQDVDAELQRISDLEAEIDQKTTEELRELMAQHDIVKRREADFKEKCKAELAELDQEITRINTGLGSVHDNAHRETVAAELAKETTAVQQLRLSVADVNRDVAALQRRIDEVPSQVELNQYQKRFLELYNQVASKHRETKQFYTLHNTLVDVQAYMKREIDLLDSIYGSLDRATQDAYKTSFVDNLNQIFDSVRQNRIKVERKETEEKMKRDRVRDVLREMQDKQRLYFKTVKDFQEECKKNEELRARLSDLSATTQQT